MNMLDYLLQNPDTRLTFWLEVEGLDRLIVMTDYPWTDPGDFDALERILCAAPLVSNQGIDSLVTCQPVSASITFKLADHGGWFRSLLRVDQVITSLALPVERSDSELRVRDAAGLPVSGTVHICRERIEYSGITPGDEFDTLTGCSRATFSLGYPGRYRQDPGGIMPVYPVSLCPMTLEGRYVRVWAMALDPAGNPMFEASDALEIWRGIIQAVPLSVDGVMWEFQAAGLESLLAQSMQSPLQGNARLIQPMYSTAPDWQTVQMVVHPSSTLTFRVSKSGGGLDYLGTDWITIDVPAGIWGFNSLQRLAKQICDAIYAYDPVGWFEFATGPDGLCVPSVRLTDDKKLQLVLHFSSTGTESIPDDASLLLAFRNWTTMDLESSIVPLLRWGFDGKTYGDLRTPWDSEDPDSALDAWTLEDLADGPHRVAHVSALRTSLACAFPDGPSWDETGHVEVRTGDDQNTELLKLTGVSPLAWTTQDGLQAFHVSVERANIGQRWTFSAGWEAESSTSNKLTGVEDPVMLEPRLVIAGDSVLRCLPGILMGLGEQSATANGPYSAEPGAGIYAAHLDQGSLTRAVDAVALTGRRYQVADGELRLQDWCGQNLALEGWCLAPGWDATGSFVLRAVEMCSASAKIWRVEADWQGAIRVVSGLGRIVNIIKVSAGDGGSGNYNDLDSLARYSVRRAQSYDLAIPATVTDLGLVGLAASRLFHLFARPTVFLSVPAPGTARTIEVGDLFEVPTPNLPVRYLVTSAQRTWVGGQEHVIISGQEVPIIDSVALAPVAVVQSALDKVAIVGPAGDLFSEGSNPFLPGTASAAVDYFEVGDQVCIYDPSDPETKVLDTVVAKWKAPLQHALELATTTPAAGQHITLWTRSTASPGSAVRYAFLDDVNDWG